MCCDITDTQIDMVELSLNLSPIWVSRIHLFTQKESVNEILCLYRYISTTYSCESFIERGHTEFPCIGNPMNGPSQARVWYMKGHILIAMSLLIIEEIRGVCLHRTVRLSPKSKRPTAEGCSSFLRWFKTFKFKYHLMIISNYSLWLRIIIDFPTFPTFPDYLFSLSLFIAVNIV